MSARLGRDEATIRHLANNLGTANGEIQALTTNLGTANSEIQTLMQRHIAIDAETATGANVGNGAFGQALCPAGDVLVGGGAGWGSGGGNGGDILNASQPVNVGGAPGGWIASGTQDTSELEPFTVTAFCAH